MRPDETALIRAVLGQQGRYGEARDLWFASGGKGTLADPGFEKQQTFNLATGPYVWQATQLPGVNVRTDRAGPPLSGRALVVSSNGVAAGPVLTQTVALPPGRYRVGLTVLARDSAVATHTGLSLACLPAGHPAGFLEDGQAPAEQGTASAMAIAGWTWQHNGNGVLSATGMAQVDGSCAGERLALTVPVWDAGPFSVWVDNIVLTKVE